MAQRERAKTLVEMAQNSVYFYRECYTYDEKAAAKNLQPGVLAPLKSLREALAQTGDWSDTAIHAAIERIAAEHDLAMGKLAQPLRVALTGGGVSPPIDTTTRLIGRERVLKRLDKAIAFIELAGPGEGE